MEAALDQEKLGAWKARLEGRLVEIEHELAPLLAEREKARQQLALIESLLALEVVPPQHREVDEGQIRHDQKDARKGEPRGTTEETPGVDGSVADVAAWILRDAGEPLHVRVIRERFLSIGRRLPGQGTESNLISHLIRDPRFARVARGTYQLQESSPAPAPRAPRRRQKTKRRGRS